MFVFLTMSHIALFYNQLYDFQITKHRNHNHADLRYAICYLICFRTMPRRKRAIFSNPGLQECVLAAVPSSRKSLKRLTVWFFLQHF